MSPSISVIVCALLLSGAHVHYAQAAGGCTAVDLGNGVTRVQCPDGARGVMIDPDARRDSDDQRITPRDLAIPPDLRGKALGQPVPPRSGGDQDDTGPVAPRSSSVGPTPVIVPQPGGSGGGIVPGAN